MNLDTSKVDTRVLIYADSVTPLTGSATFTGTTRDLGQGPEVAFAFFNAFFFTDQTGTASVEVSNDNVTWRTAATAALAVTTPLTLSIPVTTRYQRVKVVNGSTPQTLLLVTSSHARA